MCDSLGGYGIVLDKEIEVKALKEQVVKYLRSAEEYTWKEHDGHWIYNGEFYANEPRTIYEADKAKNNPNSFNATAAGAPPRKYSATEDLAFVYCELGKLYNRLTELEQGAL